METDDNHRGEGRSVLIITSNKYGNLHTELTGNLTAIEVICALELQKAALIEGSKRVGAASTASPTFTPRKLG